MYGAVDDARGDGRFEEPDDHTIPSDDRNRLHQRGLTSLLVDANGTEATDKGTATDAPARSLTMDIVMLVMGVDLRGTLDDTAAGRDFAALLPLTVALTDFHGTEKVSDLPRSLSTDGEPSGTTPSAGDIAYYAPWGNLALFYRDFSYSEGLVRLGRLEPGAAEVLSGLDDTTTLTIAATT
jgi:hypothetical protein